jgi:hypothetical protein
MVKFIHSHFKNFPAILLHYIREWLVSLSTQAFSLHWLHHLCRLSQAVLPFYLIFVFSRPQSLVSLPPTTWLSAKLVASFDVADVEVHCTIDNFVAIINEVHAKLSSNSCCRDARHTRICLLSLPTPSYQPAPILIDHLLLV